MVNQRSFAVGMDFKHVHKTISEYVYETPLAFLRENVQNALDAIRMQAHLDERVPSDSSYEIDIVVTPEQCTIRDNGIGMSEDDLKAYFWTIGASGKRNDAAREAGCVGMFGIGGFANFGICDSLTVTSKKQLETCGTRTCLTQEDIDTSTTEFPLVSVEESSDADPRGTIVSGRFKRPVNVSELKEYIASFVRFAEEKVTFNGELISQAEYFDEARMEGLRELSQKESTWSQGDISITGQWFCTPNFSTVIARITGFRIASNNLRFHAVLRMEGSAIDILKRGFKLCATSIQNQLGMSGRIDCDLMSPTAGRDSLNSDSLLLVQKIAMIAEATAVQLILASPELLEQYTRIYRYVIRNGLIEQLGNAEVSMADGSVSRLASIRESAKNGVGIYFGAHQKQALSQIMQARGNLVVLLPSDSSRKNAVQSFLQTYCNARSFSGIVECQDVYTTLDRFERVFLSEMELTIRSEFDILNLSFTVGKLTEDIPVYIAEERGSGPLKIWIDVRHSEVAKLRKLEFGPLLYSLIGTFCREYLGVVLRKKSPKFFGSGAINLDSLQKKRSELWILVKDDIHTLSRTSKRQVVRRSDVHTITAGGGTASSHEDTSIVKHPKLLCIEGDTEFADILGYYIRIPDPATAAFGDVIKQYESRGVVWAGNKILFVASDAISSAFQFEIRLEHVISVKRDREASMEGAEQCTRPVQELSGGLYFPLPDLLRPALVPVDQDEIRIEVSAGDWIDTKNANAWRARDDDGDEPSSL